MERIAVFGADAGVGTSMIAQGISEILSKECEQQILFVDASDNLYDGYTGYTYSSVGIDMIGVRDTAQQAVYDVDGYKAILGVRAGEQMKFSDDFFKTEIEDVLDQKYQFDRIIIDAGSNPRSSLCINALKYADRRVFVLRQNPKCVDKFKTMVEYIFTDQNILRNSDSLYTGNDFVILNSERNSGLLYTKSQLESMLITNMYTLPYIPNGMKCEYSRKPLAAESKKFKNALFKIIKKEL